LTRQIASAPGNHIGVHLCHGLELHLIHASITSTYGICLLCCMPRRLHAWDLHAMCCCCAQVDPLSNRVVVQPKAAAGDARTASGRTTSGRTASGRPTSAGQHHGYKGSLLFRPLPEVGHVQQLQPQVSLMFVKLLLCW
jgi:hypothetical protein